MPLDDRFGTCVEPAYVNPLERHLKPHTVLEVTSTAASQFCSVASSVHRDVHISHIIYTDFTLIWLVDRDGVLWMALEELSVSEANGATHPIPRNMVRQADFTASKLGHPALVGGEAARIGGELSYDPNNEIWILDNKSGRYGINLGRRSDHLENVAEIFRNHGLNIETELF